MSISLIISLAVGLILITFALMLLRKGNRSNEQLAKNLTDSLKEYFKILSIYDQFKKESDNEKKTEKFNNLRMLLYKYQEKYPSSHYRKEIIKIETELVDYMDKNKVD